MLAYLKKKAEENGQTFKPQSHEDYQAKLKEKRLDATVVEEALVEANAEPMKLDERIHNALALEAFFRPTYVPKPKTKESVHAINKRYTILKYQWQWCSLCSKWSNEGHMAVGAHNQRVAEMASIDEMIGPCSPTSIRRWSPGVGLMGGLSQRSFIIFWGQKVASMPQILRGRLASGAKIEVEIMHEGYKKTTKKMLSIEDISSIGFAAVSYKGDGKYKCSGGVVPERAVRWEDLEDEPDPEHNSGKFECFIPDNERTMPEGGHTKLEQMPDNDRRVILRGTIPSSSGWWPACTMRWHGQHLDHGYANH
jgi:hypothetical protein